MLVPRSALGLCLGLLISFCLFLVPFSAKAFTANPLGDFDDVAVLEVSGDYDALINDVWNHEARKVLAREFYRTHGDDYDFLVIFTNFDFTLPEARAAAYFTSVQNRVQGIGLETFDYSAGYSADGQPLERLQGTIDMAKLAGYVTDPTDPGFETTLKILAHELSHRWGAYVHFMDEQGQESDALLGIADAHWSFLLDSEGSTLYGNNWRENGDGTFTSIPPEQGQDGFNFGRIFSPLDLYLMGLLPPEMMAPMTLLEGPGVAAELPPVVGETIVATAKNVAIDQVIAAEGARLPAAGESQTEWRIGYLYAVVPGSWDSASAEARAETTAIASIGQEWGQRFSVLTDGVAMMQGDLPETSEEAENPGLALPTTTPALMPSLNDGVDWLVAHQDTEGFWRDRTGMAQCETALAVAALQNFPGGAASALQGSAWLAEQVFANSDFLARAMIATGGKDAESLLSQQNPDGGWGSSTGYQSTPLDTALALQTLAGGAAAGDAQIADAVTYLRTRQNLDGGWPSGHGQSLLQPTANALLALYGFQADGLVQTAIDRGFAWLQGQQNPDGGFGNSSSTVHDTAVALLTLKTLGASQPFVDSAVAYLLTSQSETGSWQESSFQTAMAVQALYAGLVAADLTIVSSEIVAAPNLVTEPHSQVQVSARIHNSGETAVAAVPVALYLDTVAQGNLQDQQMVGVPANDAVDLTLQAVIDSPFDQVLLVVIDPANEILEASKANNVGQVTLSVDLPAPDVGVASETSSGVETNNATIQVELTHAWDQPITLDYVANPLSSAIEPEDYSLAAGALVFAPGETSRSIDIVVVDDLLEESPETIVIDLFNLSAGTAGLLQHTYQVIDNDTPPTVSFSVPSEAGWESEQFVPVAVSLNFPWREPITVDCLPQAGSAVLGADYSLAGNPISFAVGETGQNFLVSVVDDPLIEPDEELELTLTNPVNASVSTAAFVYTIRDNDTTPQLSVSPVSASWDEAVGSVLLHFMLDHSWTVPVSVALTVDPDSSAVSEEDFVLDRTLVTFAPGETEQVVQLNILDDYPVETNESLVINLEETLGVTLLQDQLNYTILNNDIAPHVSIALPADGTVTADDTPTLLFTAETEQVVVSLNGSELPVASGQELGPLQEGLYLLRVEATDAVGRVGSAEVAFHVDTTPPEIDLISPVAGTTPDAEPLLYFQVSDGNVVVRLNGSEISQRSGELLEHLPDGEYLLAVEATDSVGNRSISQVAFAVKSAKELPAILSEEPYPVTLKQQWLSVDERSREFRNYAVDAEGNVFFVDTLGWYGTYRIEVSKYDKDLNFVWNVILDSGSDDRHVDFHFSECDSSLYVVGETRSRGCFDGSDSCVFSVYEDAVLFKINDLGLTGEVDWVQQWGGDYEDIIHGMAVDDFGNIFVAGRQEETSSFYDYNWYTFARFDAAGNKLLDIHDSEQGYCAGTAAEGFLYCGFNKYDYNGNYVELIEPPVGFSYAELQEDGYFYAGSNDNRIHKISKEGVYLQATEPLLAQPRSAAGTSASVSIRSYTVDAAGNVFVLGVTDGILGDDVPLGGDDIFLAKFDSYGRLLWTRQLGSAKNDLYRYQGSGLVFGGDEHLYFTNQMLDEFDFVNHYDWEFYQVDAAATLPLPPLNRKTYSVDSLSVCSGKTFTKGPVYATMSQSSSGCSVPDQLSLKFSGGPKKMLVAYDPLPVAVPTRVQGNAGGSLLTTITSAGGTLFAELVEVDPTDGSVLKSFGEISQSFTANAGGLLTDLSGLSGIVQPGNSFGVVVSLAADERMSHLIQWGQEGACPAGGRQRISVTTTPLEMDPPIASISFPTEGAIFAEEYVVMTGAAFDGGSGVQRVVVSADNGVNWSPATDSSADLTWESWQYVWVAPGPGSYRLLVRAIDQDGNLSVNDAAVNFVIGDTIPSFDLDAVISPARISENMSTDVWMSIVNLQHGGTLAVEQLVDLNRNGVAEEGEPVIQRFTLTDGEVDNNRNVPSDSDELVNGGVETRLPYQLVNDRLHAPAAYLFRVTGDKSSTAAVFEVEEAGEMQAISGQVADALGLPGRGAFVALTDNWGRGYGHAVTNDVGQYWLQVETPGEYRLVPMAEGYYFDPVHSVPVSLLAGQVLTGVDLQLQSGNHHFTGQVVDSETGLGIPGLLVRAADNFGVIAAGLSAADGSYSLLLPTGTFDLSVNDIAGTGPSGRGYLVPDSPVLVVEVGADSSDNEIQLVAADSLIAGRVLDAAGLPVAGVPVQASCVDDCGTAHGLSDSLGGFTLGVLIGHSWQVSLRDDVAQPLGLVGPTLPALEVTSTLSMAPDLIVSPVDVWIEGRVFDEAGNFVADAIIQAVNSVTGSRVVTRTNSDGRYRLGIDAGPCIVDFMVGLAGYDLPAPVEVVVNSGQVAVQDFVLSQVSLPNTIEVSSAVYNIRKSTLTVTASSTNPDAQLILENYGPMTMTKALKGVYTWVFSGSVVTAPATVTVSGPEGSATVAVGLK